MKKNLFNTLIALPALMVLFMSACTTWNARTWEELADRKFHFSQFRYSNLDAGKKRALAEMRAFPIGPVLESLEKKYSLVIDASEFNDFLSRGDLSGIREEGLLMKNAYVWESVSQKSNRAEIEIKVNYGDDMRVMNYGYQVSLRVDGTIRAVYFDNVAAYDMVPGRILANIGAGITTESYTSGKHPAGPDNKHSAAAERRRETEGRIMDQVEDYMKSLTPENKKKFRDDVVRHLDMITHPPGEK